ncbi:glycoside hydrolase family 3 N-terminal domain-containing protein, partial [Neobacillus vireti]|uniref:glycoside hydrolase family 3 N-terminal domain-containing protein n=1 Tax=Neobacillus vireti TaxID=220686 RepID=UPI002FFEE952
MIGTWNTILETPLAKVKVVVIIEKIDNAYCLQVKTEPIPLNFEFNLVTVEGDALQAAGRFKLLSEEKVEISLTFSEETFTGRMNLHSFGELQIKGQKGEGVSLSEALLMEVEKYRNSENIVERSNEEIQEKVNQLVARMTVLEKVGQMSQCMASNFSFGGDIEADPPEKLVEDGRAGSILGAFDINRVFELQKIAVEKSRLGIPLLFNADIIHGYQTIFPVPLAWASSWDLEGIKRACAISAKEASASGITYNHGPMVDIT